MTKKIIFFVFFFYFLILIQTSFLVHFDFLRLLPNLALFAIFLVNLFVPQQAWWGVGLAIVGGFYLDIFSFSSSVFFGLYTIISLALALFIKFFLKKYVQFSLI